MVIQNMPKILLTQARITIIISAVVLIFANVLARNMLVPRYLTVIQLCIVFSSLPQICLALKASRNDSRMNIIRYGICLSVFGWIWILLGAASSLILILSNVDFLVLLFWNSIYILGYVLFIRFEKVVVLHIGEKPPELFGMQNEHYEVELVGNNCEGGNMHVPQGGNVHEPEGGNEYYGGVVSDSSLYLNPPNAQPFGYAPTYYVPTNNDGAAF